MKLPAAFGADFGAGFAGAAAGFAGAGTALLAEGDKTLLFYSALPIDLGPPSCGTLSY